MSTTVLADGETVTLTAPPPAQTDCDGHDFLFCPSFSGTCYTAQSASDGYDYLGCCSTSDCSARTTCLPYTSGSSADCDPAYGGCTACDATYPSCVTVSNALMKQYALYCDTNAAVINTNYINTYAAATTTSTSPSPSQSSTASATATSSLRLPTSTSTTMSASPTASTLSPDPSRISKGTLAGAVIGTGVGVVLVLILGIWLYRRRRKGQTPPPAYQSNSAFEKRDWSSTHPPSTDNNVGLGLNVSEAEGCSPPTPSHPFNPDSYQTTTDTAASNIGAATASRWQTQSTLSGSAPTAAQNHELSPGTLYQPYRPDIRHTSLLSPQASPSALSPPLSDGVSQQTTPSGRTVSAFSATGFSPGVNLPYLNAETALAEGYKDPGRSHDGGPHELP